VLKIGEFSSLTQISIKTLRHYDEMGLLKPMLVDAATGYRYYSASQLPRLHRILALRDLGFPLNRIADAIDEGVTADALQGMLMLRRIEQEGFVQEEGERLARLNARLRLIELEGLMTNEVVLKDVPPQWIASMRENIPAYRMIGALFGKLYGVLGPLSLQGLGVALFHDKEFKDQDIDVEVGVYLKSAVPAHEPLTVYQLPEATVASVIHNGAFNRIGEAYEALLRWIETNGYRPAGSAREIFLHLSQPVSRNDESNVTEIQVPVEKTD
jgi:DNA-binding transcriptional MerR regulator/predicted transcriptional regulator YdeE